MNKDVPIGDAVNYGWDTWKNNIAFFLVIILILWAVQLVLTVPAGFVKSVPGWVILEIIAVVIGLVLSIGLLKITLGFIDGRQPDYSDLYRHYRLFWKYLGAAILAWLVVMGGLILLIIPGIYLAVRLYFVPYFVVDRELGPTDAISASWEATRGAWWGTFAYSIVAVGITLLGALACGVGLFVAIPVVMVATAYVYRSLAAQAYAAQNPPQQAPPEQTPPPAR